MCKHDSTTSNSKEKSDYGQMTVAQLVSENPLRATVFEEYHIDFCCGGNITLEEACLRKGIRIEEVREKISALEQKSSPGEEWTEASLLSLANHIVMTYHQPLREQLAYVAKLAEKVARVHGANHPEMIAVERLFVSFRDEMEAHMQKEEMVLFPAIVSLEKGESAANFGCGQHLEMPIMVMMQEHEQAGQMLAQFRSLTNGYSPPPDACHSFKVLLFLLHTIETDLHLHVHKENNILFPRALALKKAKELVN